MTTDLFRIDERDVAHLRDQWNELAALYTTNEDLKCKSFEMLKDKYTEKGRFYHSLGHIKALLSLFESLKHMIQDKEAIRFAIWFHDIIYNTKRTDNEERSAELATKILSELNVHNHTIDLVRQLILATKDHKAGDLSQDAKLFLDMDLSILGVSEGVYRDYSKAIRNEYSWVPYFLYRSSRKKILKSFLDRERIYFTAEMNNRFETKAKINIENEIKSL